mgnify:CR=1 FL=1
MHAPDPATFIAAGASAQVYRLEGGRVLKLFHAGIDPSIVAREYAIARVVQTSGLPVPAVFGETRVEGRQGIIYAEMRGPNLLTYMARHPHRARKRSQNLCGVATTGWKRTFPRIGGAPERTSQM